jgi:hypothetical protein
VNGKTLSGSCQCGNIHYRVVGKPLVAIACHCNDCRKLSGSAFSTVLVVNADDLVVDGDLKMWERATDTGRRSQAFFCPECGNRIYHLDPDAAHIKRIRSGSLDQADIPEPRIHLFAERTQSWLAFANDPIVFDRQPNAEELYEAMAAVADDSP